ncbi:hypothetical protein FQA39_LY09382 [Lamprigera yunnana]|nr:hypothetical protein FQA39_LY09382 [Lamprigera yunnana]
MIELSSAEPQDAVVLNPSWWQGRTYLEKRLLIVVVIVAGVIFSFFVDALLNSKKEDVSVCNTLECITASSNILHQIDETVSPCDDFFKFACSKIARRTHHRDIPLEIVRSQMKKKMLNILLEPINEKDHPALRFEKRLFTSCIDEFQNGTSLEVLKSLLDDLNGWPVLLGSKWKEEHFEWAKTISKLRNLGLYHSMILRINVHENDSNPLDSNISIKTPTLFPPNDEVTHVLKKFIVDQAVGVGAGTVKATSEMTDVYNFMITLNELNNLRGNETDKITRLHIYELQVRYPNIDWLKYINSMLEPFHNVTDKDYVLLPHPDLIDKLFEIINSTSKRTMANYILWSATAEIIPLISYELLAVYNDLNCFKNYVPKEIEDKCEEAASLIFNPIPSYVTYANRYVSKKSKKQINEMFSLIKSEFKRLINISTLTYESSREKIEKWFDTIVAVVGASTENIDDFYQHHYEHEMANSNESFLKTYLSIKKKYYQRSRTKDSKYFTKDIMSYLIPETRIFFYKPENALVLPAGILQGVYFDETRPMYMNFGSFGKCIASVLSNSYSLAGMDKDLNSKLWTKEEEDIFTNRTDCLKHHSPISDSEWSRHVGRLIKFTQVMAMTVAYNAYKKWEDANGQELKLIGLNYTQSQLFWISAMSDICYEENHETEFNFLSDNEVIRYSYNFANDFNCELESYMNPTKKCIIF